MKKLLSIAFAVCLMGASSAWAQFTTGMTSDQVKNEIAKQKRDGKSADAIADAAFKAGIAVDTVMSGLVAAGFAPGVAIAASMKAGFGETAVVNAAVATQAITLADAQSAAANARPASASNTNPILNRGNNTPGSTGAQGTGSGGGKAS